MLTMWTIVILAMSVMAGVGAWLYFRWYTARHEGPAAETPTPAVRLRGPRETNIKDLWGVEDVRRGVLILSGGHYRILCRLSAVDYWLLSDVEQNSVEDAAAAAIMQLSFPVQTLATSHAVETRTSADELRQRADSLPGILRDMALARAEYLDALTQEKSASARQAYLVIPYDTVQGFKRAFGELQARLTAVASALAVARVRVEPLSSEAVVDLLSHLLNRGRHFIPSEAVEAGGMSLYHVSERSVV